MCVYIKLQQEISPISLFDANIGSETTAVIDRATAKPAEARTIYAKEYVDGNRYLAAASYDRAFNKYYEAGKKGMSFSDIKRSSRDIKADSARRIYEAGRRATENESKRQSKYKQTAEYKSRSEARTEANAKAKKNGGVIRSYAVDKKINRLQRQQLRVLDEWARQKGVTVQVAASLSEKIKLEGKVINGRYDGGNVITIALDGKNMLTSTAGHELYHMIENLAPEYAKDFRSFVIDHLKEAGEYDSVFGDYERRYKNTYKVDESFKAKIEEEIVADHCFEALTNKEQWEKFAGEHKSIAEKIIDFIKEFVAKINNAFEKYFVHDNAYIRDSVIGEVEYMNKIADMLWEGVDKAVENYRSGAVNESGETKYQLVGETPDGIEVYETSQGTLNKSLKERKKAYLDLMRNEYAGRTARFVRNGHTYYAEFDRKNYSKPIYGEKHNSKRGLAALIRSGADGDVFDLVENSRYADSSADTKNHKAKDGFTDYFDYFVKTVQIDGRVYDLTATVKKQYGEKNGFTYSLFLKDNKKIKAAPTKDIKYIPQRSAQPSSNTTVPQGNGNVNTHSMQKSKNNSSFSVSDSNGNRLSENQQKYFADSKVRDENGNLLVVRHGTNNEFNIFDFTKAGKNGAQEGYGFYFSDDPEITEKYGSIQKECYLNITKPLYNNQVTVNKTEIKKLADALIDFDIEKYADEDLTWQDSFLSNYVDTYSMSRAAAVREFVDQLFSTNDNDSDLVYEMAVADGRSYDPMLVKEFYDVLTDSIGYDGIIAEWKHKDGTSNVYVIFNSEQAKLTDNQNPTDNPDVRYSISQNAEADIDDVLNNKIQTEDIQLTDSSPSIILGQKGVRNLPMLMKASHIRENILTESEMKSRGFAVDEHTHYHGLGKELFLDVIRDLDDVTLAYRGTKNAEKSERRQNYFLLISQHSSDKGTINVPVYINEHGLYNRVEIDTNKIGTVFGRDNLKSFLEQEVRKGNLVRIKKRSSLVGELAGDKVPTSYGEATSRGGSEVSEKPTTKADDYYSIASDNSIHQSNEKSQEKFSQISKKFLTDETKTSISDAGMRLTDNAELSSLIRDNADYKAEIERLKGEFVKSKRMGGKGKNRLVQADINRIARDIISEYSSKIDFSTLRDELTGLYELMDNIEMQGSADYAEFVKLSNDIAKSVIASSYVDITDQSAEKYKAAMRSYRLTPSLQDVAELEDMFGTFGAAYRQYGKKLNMRAKGTENAFYIDEVWEDLCETVPLLDRNADSTQEMWRNLIEVRDSLDEKTGFNPYLDGDELSAGQAAAVLGADILERFNEVSPDTTFADRAQQRIDLRFPIVVMRVKIFSLTSCSDIINPSLNRTLSRNSLTARPTAHTLVPHDIKQCKQVYRQQCMMHKIVFVCKRCGLKAHSGRTRSHL